MVDERGISSGVQTVTADHRLARLFWENTKIRNYELPMADDGMDYVRELRDRLYVRYASEVTRLVPTGTNRSHDIPQYRLQKKVKSQVQELVNAIGRRRTVRCFSGKGLSATELSTLLHAYRAKPAVDETLGVRRRNVPSAGALYPLEVYVTLPIGIGATLRPGVYHYESDGHRLLLVSAEAKVSEVAGVLRQPNIQVEKSAVIFFIAGVLERSAWKYGDRGLRYVMLEAGHLAQNFCLLASVMNLGACLVGGFIDDGVAKYLEIDGWTTVPLYVLVMGKNNRASDNGSRATLSDQSGHGDK
jgi:SagB-type dehydrogenase family enzyme